MYICNKPNVMKKPKEILELEKFYKFTINETDYTLDENENVITLVLKERNISDISPLQQLIHLQDLDLSLNLISDILPLYQLTQLNELDLSGNQIFDINALNNLNNLIGLNLNYNKVILPVSLMGLNSLERFALSKNSISSIKCFSDLIKLKALYLYDNRISDIYPLENLKNLEHINLAKNLIVNIEPLKHLIKLKTLNINSNFISNISVVENLSSLQNLSVSDNNISNILPINKLNNLIRLETSRNPFLLKTTLDFNHNSFEKIQSYLQNPKAFEKSDNIRDAEIKEENLQKRIKELEVVTEEDQKIKKQLLAESKAQKDEITELKRIKEKSSKDIQEAIKDLNEPNKYLRYIIVFQYVLIAVSILGVIFLINYIYCYFFSAEYQAFILKPDKETSAVQLFAHSSPLVIMIGFLSFSVSMIVNRLKNISHLKENERRIKNFGGSLNALHRLSDDDMKSRETISNLIEEFSRNQIKEDEKTLNHKINEEDLKETVTKVIKENIQEFSKFGYKM